jgi:hypothetical protein
MNRNLSTYVTFGHKINLTQGSYFIFTGFRIEFFFV